MIAIIDYGMGNLRSVQKAIESLGAAATITHSEDEIFNAQKIVLPGVGAINSAMERLKALKLCDPIHQVIDQGTPFLGICLGYQLLFQDSNEGGNVKGLGVLKGKVTRFTDLKIPHIGWNQVEIQKKDCPLFNNVPNNANTYFCHSYYVQPEDENIITSRTNYGLNFASSINTKKIYGVQFHPEKSQKIGLQILKNFVEIT